MEAFTRTNDAVSIVRPLTKNMMATYVMAHPRIVRSIGLNLTPEVGADDALVQVPVVPAGRDGNVIFGRTLGAGEADSGQGIRFDPTAGEELHFRPGSVCVTLRDVDQTATNDPDGYALITNTMWTWFTIASPTDAALFRYLLAAARRLDTSHSLYANFQKLREEVAGAGAAPRQREIAFRALGLIEIFCIVLDRALRMLCRADREFGIKMPLKQSIAENAGALREFRNAFEHIDERALSQKLGKEDSIALTIFDQGGLFSDGCLKYGHFILSLENEILPMIRDARATILEMAVQVSGPAWSLPHPIKFGNSEASRNGDRVAGNFS